MPNKPIWEYLAETSSPVQLVKHMDEVLESKIKYPLMGQKKYDGIYVLVVMVQGDPNLYSRTGHALYWRAVNAVEKCIYSDLAPLPDGVYIAEYCNDAVSLEVLAGLVSSNRKKVWTHEEEEIMFGDNEQGFSYLMFHDLITVDELLAGHSSTPYKERYTNLCSALPFELQHYRVQCNLLHNRDEVDAAADLIIEAGGEGIVAKDPNAGWVAGHKGFHAMKIVRGLHVDLECVGVEYGKGKRAKQIAKLKFAYKGNVFAADLGKGWTDQRRKELTDTWEASEEHGVPLNDLPLYPVGKIWELKALQESSTGKALRLPKVVRIREDKETPDA